MLSPTDIIKLCSLDSRLKILSSQELNYLYSSFQADYYIENICLENFPDYIFQSPYIKILCKRYILWQTIYQISNKSSKGYYTGQITMIDKNYITVNWEDLTVFVYEVDKLAEIITTEEPIIH